MADVVVEDTLCILTEVPKYSGRCHTNAGSCPDTKDVDKLALPSNIRVLQYENHGLPFLQSENHKHCMDPPLKLCTEKKKTGLLS